MNSVQVVPEKAADTAKVPDAEVQVRTSDDGQKQQHSVQFKAAPTPDPKPAATPEGERPAWLPEKFKTADDLKKSATELAKKNGADDRTLRLLSRLSPEDLAAEYAEMEKGAGKQAPQPKAEEKKDDGEGKQEVEKQKQEADDLKIKEEVNGVLKAAGLALDDIQKEWDSKGELSPESYEKLSKTGFSRDVVDAFIEGRLASAQLHLNTIFSHAGGDRAAYETMTTWAKDNLATEDVVAYNNAMAGTKSAQIAAVKGLFARYQQAGGSEPAVTIGGGTKSGEPEGDVYRSVNELLADQRDPRYRSGDKAFHAMVDRKLSRSKISF